MALSRHSGKNSLHTISIPQGEGETSHGVRVIGFPDFPPPCSFCGHRCILTDADVVLCPECGLIQGFVLEEIDKEV